MLQPTTKRLSSRPTSGWQSKWCLRVDLNYRTRFHYGQTECCAVSRKLYNISAMLLTPEFLHDWTVWVRSCRFISEISQPPYSVCSSSLRLSQSVRAFVSYLTKTNFECFMALSVIGLPRLLLHSNSRTSRAFELLLSLTMQWSMYSYTDRLS